ncbi:hypothetical protein OE88DRAFT_544486 [Heliocybe sulcata]|uniref:DUF6534 domain-containing protein n=1 Tax=Heliocybe sulcata TaxID=5364 RepID=A0A5C3N2Y4_9AGAM|nr:hypothetical protein OE88DRAFT_544486 [Heliocybe sulcata]
MANPLADTFALMLIAFFIDAVLYGAGILLASQYFQRYPNDPLSSRLTVLSMAVVMTVQICTYFAWVYYAFIDSFGQFTKIDIMIPFAVTQLLAIYIVAFISQCFFAVRVWRLSHHNIWLTGWVALLAGLQITAGIAQTTLSAKVGRFSALASTERVTTIQSAATAACDLSITIILITLFHTSRTGIKRTDTLLNRLIVFAINRGALTTLAAFFNMLFFVVFPATFIFMLPLLPSGQLYLISVTTALISRHTIADESSRGANVSAGSQSYPLSNVQRTHGRTVPAGAGVHVVSPIFDSGVSSTIVTLSLQTTSVLTWNGADAEAGQTFDENDSSTKKVGGPYSRLLVSIYLDELTSRFRSSSIWSRLPSMTVHRKETTMYIRSSCCAGDRVTYSAIVYLAHAWSERLVTTVSVQPYDTRDFTEGSSARCPRYYQRPWLLRPLSESYMSAPVLHP